MIPRQKWNTARFHAMSPRLVGVSSGEHVLDLGCGRGSSLEPLLDAVGNSGRVVGLDHAALFIEEAARKHSGAIQRGRLSLIEGDVLDPPFPDEIFDVVICQNVAECVDDRPALISSIRRVLKPGGRLLLGHHDFDGILISGGDRYLTRRLVHAFADHTQDWQDTSEGQMGRMIPGLLAKGGFATVNIETNLFVDLDLSAGSYARDYLAWVVNLASDIGFERSEVTAWVSSLEAASAENRFFFGLPWVAAICQKAAA